MPAQNHIHLRQCVHITLWCFLSFLFTHVSNLPQRGHITLRFPVGTILIF
nr:MAG TPA: hypothetical protein [Bacteriophage sp.]